METAGPVGAALGLAVASGLSLYGAVFVSGLAIRLGFIHLAPAWTSLGMLADPLVLAVSGVLFAVEFLADKIPVVDSLWDFGGVMPDPGPRGARRATSRRGCRRKSLEAASPDC